MNQEARQGNKIQCKGITITIKEILYQDFYNNNWSIEFIDDKENYRYWKQEQDGGKLIQI